MRNRFLLVLLIGLITFGMAFNKSTAQIPIATFEKKDPSSGVTINHALYDYDVRNIFMLYKMVKKKDDAIDDSVQAILQAILLKVFQENPEKTANQLQSLRIGLPAIQISVAALMKDGTQKEIYLNAGISALLNQVLLRLDADPK
jgi:hypothetical protein